MEDEKWMEKCPFCNADGCIKSYTIFPGNKSEYEPACSKCQCLIQGGFKSMDEAREAWNKRGGEVKEWMVKDVGAKVVEEVIEKKGKKR